MIVSHKHKFVFIKTRKTAGTSVEVALSKHCGPDDIITPIREEDERKAYGGKGPQNYRRSLLHYSIADWRRFIVSRKRQDFRNHLPGPRVMKMLPKYVPGQRDKAYPLWQTYFTFAVERSPWDKVISGYYWTEEIRKIEGRPSLTMSEFIMSDHIHDYCDWHRYAIGDQIIVDRVLRFEHLANDFAEVCTKLNLPITPLPRIKSTHRKDARPHWEVLTESEVERIRQVFAKEISTFGYTFTPR
jgi:hypothetical protein